VLDPREFLRTKREGRAHDPEALAEFIGAFARREIPDYQMSAWLMAAFLRGLDATETDALTRALLGSGRAFDWQTLGRPTADKHSTGGVGDKISLVLAPLVAACGVAVPMVSGRGLGHTGGTLDKLESIPGFRTTLSPAEMKAQLERTGVIMVGQGPDLAPADGMLYALRDVTATVEFEPFIVSSIVSKKIAEGARAIVYDIKCGNGAFMKTREQARSLATRLVATSRGLGAKATAFITDMSWPIGRAAGNALEVDESWAVLKGARVGGTRDLTLTLSAEMVRLAGVERDSAAARARVEKALDQGSALETFRAMVRDQGGDLGPLEAGRSLAPAPEIAEVRADREGVLASCDCFELGEMVVAIGGGRRTKESAIDPRVGITLERSRGDRVKKGDVIARLHLAAPDEGATRRAAACFGVADETPAPLPADLVLERIEG
jgi:pyrimidine-nucleoside phosphorylase